MAEFKLGRIRFVWKDNWVTGTEYYKDDIIAYGGKTYLCVVGHTAAADFYTDLNNLPTRWNLFADGTQWKGNWAGTTLYKINDIVKYGGYVYICKLGHTSQSTLELDQSNWDLFAEGLNWLSNWATSTTYKVNDLVKYGGYVYVANQAHTSAGTTALGLENDQSKWDLFSKGFDWKGAWTTSTRYKVGDLIKYGGTTYVCNQYHTSAATAALGLENDQSKWDYFNQGLDYKGAWVTTTRYKVNDVVKNGGGTFICVTNHTASAAFSTDNAYWNKFVEGTQFDGDWNGSSTNYQAGDIVRYGGNSYFSKTNHVSGSGSPPSTNTTDWSLFSQGFRVVGDWAVGTGYKIGEVVRNGGFTYVAASDSTGQKPPNATYWTKLNEGIRWKGAWVTSTVYELGDSVKFGPISYICIAGHTASTGNRPDNDVSGTYWNLLTSGNENDVLTTLGDLVYYGGAGATRLPVGVEGQVLAVRSGLPAWTYFGRVTKVFYVGPNGTNSPAPTYGLTIDQPWASVRYGLEQIREGTENPNAKYLLSMNRTFIQKEVAEWMDYQKTNNISPFTSGSVYDKTKSQRDVGLVLDAIIYDLSHTGNEKSIAAARSFFTALGVSYLTNPTYCTAALGYMKTLIGNILANTAPSTNYQSANGISVGSRILQIIDTNYTAESTAASTSTTLATIVTDAITAGNLNSLPVADTPNVTLFVKTGQYYEVFPMIVPAGTAIVGDELRSTRISPAAKIIATNDKAKSVAALTRLQNITTNIITNVSVTPTTGNSATQYTALQKAGNTGSSTAVTSVNNNITEIKNIINTGTASSYVYPDPTGYGSGFSNARRLILANKTFLQAEVSAFVPFTYGTSISSIDGTGELFNTGTAHGLTAGAKVGFSSTQGGVTQGVTYYVLAAGLTTTAFSVTATQGSLTAVNLSTVASPSPAMKVFAYDAAKCARDIGYEVDALVYDLTYGETSGCNLATQIAARSYYSNGTFVEPSTEKTAALGTQARIKTIITQIAQAQAVTATAGNVASQDTSGTAGSSTAGTFAQARVQEVYDAINTGTEPTTIAPSTAWVASALVTSNTLLAAAKTAIKSDTTNYIDTQYPTLVYNKTTCARDVGYVVDYLGYDLLFGSNYLSVLSGLAYRRGTTSASYVIANQKQATIDTWTFVGSKAAYIVAGGATQVASQLWTDIINYVNTGTRPIVTGSNTPIEDTDLINGSKILLLNKAFMQAEATAYINNTYKSTVTASTGGSTDTFTCGSQTWMVAGDQVRFTGTVFGGISTGVTYYILSSGLTSTSFKVSLTAGGSAVDLSTATGSMTVSYYYSTARCQNDVGNYVEAIAKDMFYTGNYNSVMAARYYRNALTGSKLEDGFYVRNGCGLRNMTFTGLDGTSDGNTAGANPISATGLTVTVSAYNTKRPLAGAYVSLDPGWGPNDDRVWVTTRSTYVQNVTTFGTACVGQKIDGSLHAGGNDSIVSNDFTQVLSDGIGAWVTNLGRAELVSVFTYYNYMGYLAENGGKIRATNGNNSYGTFGSVSEYIDVTETPVTGFVNNRASPANIANVIVDGNNVLAMEYANAGTAYYSATYSISGAGNNAAVRENEYRDGATYQVRMIDPGDSTGGGGANYLTQSNTGQGGTATAISLAVSDQQSSAAYVGMSVYITAGTGAGQYGNIITYNAGSKLATVTKDSFTPLTVTATAVTTNLVTVSNFTTLVTGQAVILDTAIGGLSAAPTVYYVLDVPVSTQIPVASVSRSSSTATVVTSVAHGLATGHTVSIQYTGTALDGDSAKVITKVDATTFTYTSSTSGTISSTPATSGKVAPDSKITLKSTSGGSTAVTLSTATGTSTLYAAGWDHIIPGTAIQSALSITTNYVITPRLSFTAPTYSTASVSMPTSANWTDIAYGDGYGAYTGLSGTSSVGSLATFDVVRRNGSYTVTLNVPGVLYTANTTITILGTALGGTTPANDLVITVATVNAPSGSIATFTTSGTAITPKLVAVASGSSSGGYSTDGGATWTAMTLPSSSNWTSVAYGVFGNIGYFTAVASGTAATAYSTNGISWTAGTTGQSASWSSVAYGNGRFVAVSLKSAGTGYAAISTNGGVTWSAGALTVNIDAISVAYGNNRFVAVETAAAGSTNALYSADGITWVGTTLPSTSNWTGVAYGNGKFVAVSKTSMGNTAYLLDGSTTWVGGQLPAYTDWNHINYGNGVFIASGLGANASVGVGASSQDGINWTQRDLTTASFTVTATAKDTNPGSYSATSLTNTAYWTDVMWSGAQFVAIGHDNATTAYAMTSPNGTTWTARTLPSVSGAYTYSAIAWNGSNQYIAVIQDSRHIATSTDGATWTGTINALPTTGSWSDMVYGGGKYVMVSGGQNRTSYSTDGVTWLTGSISASATEYTGIAYGLLGATNYYVVVAGLTGTSQVSAYSTDGITWTAGTQMPSADLWSSVAYGNGRFVAVAGSASTTTTKAAYSTTAGTWVSATMPGAAAKWVKVTYGGGAFTAFAYGGTRTAYSTDGITWVEGPALPATRNWDAAAYGNSNYVALATGGTNAGAAINFLLDTNLLTTSGSTSGLDVGDPIKFTSPIGTLNNYTTYYVTSIFSSTQFTVGTTRGGSNTVMSTASGSMVASASKYWTSAAVARGSSYVATPKFVVIGSGTQKQLQVTAGATTKARAYVSGGKIATVWINEPGSFYASAPTMTIVDPNNTGSDAPVTVRIGNGALAQPNYSNRGTNYTAASASLTGSGYADNYQLGNYISFTGLTSIPQPGSNVQIAGIDKIWYRLVTVTSIVQSSTTGLYSATLQISPKIGVAEAPEHLTGVTIRRRYSQVRLTGHDFLSIGTGNIPNTNYPNTPLLDATPATETKNYGGGRVFYTSTDQDGNFRVGGLFNVEQSTGVATLNADAFNIAGLNELSLGSVALGGSGAKITEFSTDPYFTQNSDSVVPTQRAIKAYITSQIGGGGSQLNVNTLTAGVVYIAGQTITTTTNVAININTKVNFKGGITGDALVLNYFLQNN